MLIEKPGLYSTKTEGLKKESKILISKARYFTKKTSLSLNKWVSLTDRGSLSDAGSVYFRSFVPSS